MGLAVAIQMDPIDTINIDADSTFALALEAQARGHALFHYLPDALTLRDGRLHARGRPLEVFRRHGHHHRFGAFEELDLGGLDVVLMRQDPRPICSSSSPRTARSSSTTRPRCATPRKNCSYCASRN